MPSLLSEPWPSSASWRCGTRSLVDEHQPPGVKAARKPPPKPPDLLVTLGGYWGLFLSGQPPPSERPEIARLTVAVETFTLKASSNASQCSSRVRSGLARRW